MDRKEKRDRDQTWVNETRSDRHHAGMDELGKGPVSLLSSSRALIYLTSN